MISSPSCQDGRHSIPFIGLMRFNMPPSDTLNQIDQAKLISIIQPIRSGKQCWRWTRSSKVAFPWWS